LGTNLENHGAGGFFTLLGRADQNMKLDPTTVSTIAKQTQFQPNNIEKVIRLRQLLTEFHKHPFLRGKLVLKGGTAINLFNLGMARLSVDIDLNYIAHVSGEEMLKDRPEIAKAVQQIATGLGYRVQSGVDEHALKEVVKKALGHSHRHNDPGSGLTTMSKTCRSRRKGDFLRSKSSAPRGLPKCRPLCALRKDLVDECVKTAHLPIGKIDACTR
jgi:Nucleotidyl transferase AbiEii toxin, Type IV TA system